MSAWIYSEQDELINLDHVRKIYPKQCSTLTPMVQTWAVVLMLHAGGEEIVVRFDPSGEIADYDRAGAQEWCNHIVREIGNRLARGETLIYTVDVVADVDEALTRLLESEAISGDDTVQPAEPVDLAESERFAIENAEMETGESAEEADPNQNGIGEVSEHELTPVVRPRGRPRKNGATIQEAI